MADRCILHCDINHCYAQIEEMKYPQLRNVAMVIAGRKADRHGIILAKNDLAKKYHISTGEPIHKALEKCPSLIVIEPNYEDCIYYTSKVKDIYRRYSDMVESFGIDEAWIDVSGSQLLFGSAEVIGRRIQKEVWEEVGLSISVGLSFNKIMAKFASDYVKPMGFTVITRENYQDILYPSPIEELLYVGRQTKGKLNAFCIDTIGDLASMSREWLAKILGKQGELLWDFAHGLDASEVLHNSYYSMPKSIGNSTTTKRDIDTFEEARHVFYVLAESVASRAKDLKLQGNVVQISLRNNKLEVIQRQVTLKKYTNISTEIMQAAMILMKDNYDFELGLRGVGVTLSGCRMEKAWLQYDLFEDFTIIEKDRIIDETMDCIRNKFGFNKVKRCSMLCEEDLTSFNPKGEHVIFPVSFFKS